ncbi:MAG: hypothetical protein K2J36_02705 [Ruminococcus sp.]|nr:hypothetical protein [Ruminococcus sp.]MDE6796911.1 hypothetical protein [Ruminococcus sp.]
MIPIAMIIFISIINELAEQSKNGIKPFSKAKEIFFSESTEINKDNISNPIYYDDTSPDENGNYPVIQDYLSVKHHDIISHFSKCDDIFGMYNLEIKAEVSEDNNNARILIKSINDENWKFCIHDGIFTEIS